MIGRLRELTVVRSASVVLAASMVLLVASSCGDDAALGDGISITAERSGEDGDAGGEGGATDPDEAAGDGGEAAGDDDGADDDPTADGGGDDPDGDPGDDDGSGGDDDDPSALPGEPFTIGPRAGEALDVVGVRHDDVLNFRALPDATAAIVATAAPLETSVSIVSSGEGRLLTRSLWWKVTVDGDEAWANFTFLGQLGQQSDVSAELLAELPSTTYTDLDELADDLAAIRSDGPEPLAEVAAPVTRFDSDAGEAVIDIVGIGDDAVKGERYLLTFDIVGANTYELVEARRTVICGRGVSGGLCL